MDTVRIKKRIIPPELLQYFKLHKEGDRWRLRNQIIWHKPNCMPSSVEDRFTVDFEPMFFFSKSKKYFFEPQFEKATSTDDSVRDRDNSKLNNTPGRTRMGGLTTNHYTERNKRCVWKIPTQPYSEAHFATFPKKLVEVPIKAGCPEFICKKCGKAREKIFEKIAGTSNECPQTQSAHEARGGMGKPSGTVGKSGSGRIDNVITELGYSDCECNAGFEAGIVLDPFFGSGTTGWVAQYLGRKWIGIELSEEYIKIAKQRFAQDMLL